MIYYNGSRRSGRRLTDKQIQARQAPALARKPISDVMWAQLLDLYQARNRRLRGIVAPMSDQTLNALFRRNLATGKAVPGGGGPGEWLWFTTDEGAALAKRGRDEA